MTHFVNNTQLETATINTLLRHVRAAQPKKSSLRGIWYPHAYEKAALARHAALPKNFWTGYAGDAWFDKPKHHNLRVRAYQSASAALDAFFAGPTVADCGSAIAAAQWQAVRGALGDAKFDAVFGDVKSSTNTLRRMSIAGFAAAWEPLAYFVDWGPTAYEACTFDKAQARRGDLYYIQGVAHYEAKHPDGIGRGYNVVYAGDNALGEPLFTGFDLHPACTEAEIRSLLVDCYNEPRSLRARAYIKHSPCPSAYDLKAQGLAETLTLGAHHALGLLASTQRRLRWDRLWQACNTSADTLIRTVDETLAERLGQHTKCAL